jgi:hypothetical protein
MKLFLTLILLTACTAVHADVWMWVDAKGNTHFVDTVKPIFTWVDESGDVHYSDTPDHEDAVSVELIWVSDGGIDEYQNQTADSGQAYPGETPAQRAEREAAEAYYCKRATEIYDSYVKAPRLYKTSDDGERQYLTEEEGEQTIAEMLAKKEELCR